MKFLSRLHSHHRIYLDYAAATPLRKEVVEAMIPVLRTTYGNPSAIHAEGQAARTLVEAARQHIARILQTRERDIIFTSGGTEANNIALFGYIEAQLNVGKTYDDMEIITTVIEHPSLTKACAALRASGLVVHDVRVREDGRIDLDHFNELLNERTVLVVTSYVNSEIGTIQPLLKLKRAMQQVGQAVLLVDGAQAPLWVPCQLAAIGADILTLDGGKCYGPKGSGLVAWKHGLKLSPTLFGGGQEEGLRPGTENVAGIIGLETALAIAQENRERRTEGIAQLRDYFIEQLSVLPGVVVNGSLTDRVANNVNISLPGFDTEFAVVWLSEHGVAASTKSACSGAGSGESVVVKAISGDAARAAATIRFTLGEESRPEHIDTVVELLQEFMQKQAQLTQS